MVKLSPYRMAVSVVASTLILVAAGAAVTSSREVDAYRSLLGVAATVVSVLTVILSVRLWSSHRALSVALIGFVLLLGLPAEELASFRAAHAFLAQGFFALGWVAMVITSPKWAEGPSIVQDGGVPSLRSLASFGAVVTGLQVILGAGFRHGVMGVVPHVVGAIATTVVLVVVGTFTITQFPKHRQLVGGAWHLIGLVTIQIGLGVIAYIGRLNQVEGSVPTTGLIASTVAHVVFGALTLAASVALALKVHYHVRPRAAFESGLPVASR